MTTLKEQITSLLNTDQSNNGDIIHLFFQSEMSEDLSYRYDPETEFIETLKSNGISFKLEDNHGGEGEGDQFWSVYSFSTTNETEYVKFEGYYQSYNGSEYQEWYFVEPKQVTVTQFEKVHTW